MTNPIAWTTRKGNLIYRCEEDGPYFERTRDGLPMEVHTELPEGVTPLAPETSSDDLRGRVKAEIEWMQINTWRDGMVAGLRLAKTTITAFADRGITLNHDTVETILDTAVASVGDLDVTKVEAKP